LINYKIFLKPFLHYFDILVAGRLKLVLVVQLFSSTRNIKKCWKIIWSLWHRLILTFVYFVNFGRVIGSF